MVGSVSHRQFQEHFQDGDTQAFEEKLMERRVYEDTFEHLKAQDAQYQMAMKDVGKALAQMDEKSLLTTVEKKQEAYDRAQGALRKREHDLHTEATRLTITQLGDVVATSSRTHRSRTPSPTFSRPRSSSHSGSIQSVSSGLSDSQSDVSGSSAASVQSTSSLLSALSGTSEGLQGRSELTYLGPIPTSHATYIHRLVDIHNFGKLYDPLVLSQHPFLLCDKHAYRAQFNSNANALLQLKVVSSRWTERSDERLQNTPPTNRLELLQRAIFHEMCLEDPHIKLKVLPKDAVLVPGEIHDTPIGDERLMSLIHKRLLEGMEFLKSRKNRSKFPSKASEQMKRDWLEHYLASLANPVQEAIETDFQKRKQRDLLYNYLTVKIPLHLQHQSTYKYLFDPRDDLASFQTDVANPMIAAIEKRERQIRKGSMRRVPGHEEHIHKLPSRKHALTLGELKRRQSLVKLRQPRNEKDRVCVIS